MCVCVCLFVCWVNKTRVVKPLRRFHSWILSFRVSPIRISSQLPVWEKCHFQIWIWDGSQGFSPRRIVKIFGWDFSKKFGTTGPQKVWFSGKEVTKSVTSSKKHFCVRECHFLPRKLTTWRIKVTKSDKRWCLSLSHTQIWNHKLGRDPDRTDPYPKRAEFSTAKTNSRETCTNRSHLFAGSLGISSMCGDCGSQRTSKRFEPGLNRGKIVRSTRPIQASTLPFERRFELTAIRHMPDSNQQRHEFGDRCCCCSSQEKTCLFVCFVCLFVCLFVCFVCLFGCLVCLFVCLFVRLFAGIS